MGKNRENYEYLKEFNKLNNYAPHFYLLNSITGDYIQVNKGFLEGIGDTEDHELNQDDNKFHYLAEKDEFSAKEVDFDDPAALLRRQKAILKAIEKH